MLRLLSAIGLLLRLPQIWFLFFLSTGVVMLTAWRPILDILVYAAWRLGQ